MGLDVLVLGGTSFVGRWVVEALLAAGHRPTLFTRGRTGPELFPGVPRRVGDRQTGDYGDLSGHDAVVDVSGYVPRHVVQASDAVAEARRYLFVSTVSVYDRRSTSVSGDESSPRLAPHRASEEVTGETYGPLKVACEDDVRARWGDRASIVRPGIVAGPHDPTDRFTAWVRRASQGGRMAVPGRLQQPIQVVDARDLARLVVLMLELDRPSTVDAVGPRVPVTLEQLATTCALGADLSLVEVAARSFPLVLDDPADDVLFQRSGRAARELGMPSTPLETTARDTLSWDRERGQPPLSVGLSPEDEAGLLSAPRTAS